MKRFSEIFWLELRALMRSKTVAMLSVASVAWMFVFPCLVKGDGTPEGARELYLHYSLGGVFLLLVLSLLSSATGSIAGERAAKRLQLTLVRPVRYASVALGKMAAHVAVGAFVLVLASAALAVRVDLSTPCNSVLSPVLPTPKEEARQMYEAYMNDPGTPDQIRKARKEVVLRILEQKAVDHYQTIPTNVTERWTFASPGDVAGLKVRIRFTNPMEMRQDLIGEFRFGGCRASVSNITQAILSVPLVPAADGKGTENELVFRNDGANAIMLRPRRDLNLLVPADAFVWNLMRTGLELLAILALVIAFGTFLSAALGRPVALFVAIVTLIVSEMSPSVIEQYPDAFEKNRIDRIGLMMTRFAAEVTRPVAALSPLGHLAKDEKIEGDELARVVFLDLVLVPLLFAFLAGIVMPRKQDDL